MGTWRIKLNINSGDNERLNFINENKIFFIKSL